MTSPELLLILNAAICGGIAIRVLLFRRDGSRHRWWGGWLAYLLIVVAASVPSWLRSSRQKGTWCKSSR